MESICNSKYINLQLIWKKDNFVGRPIAEVTSCECPN